MNFLMDFTSKYESLLNKRFSTFYKIFEYLETLQKKSYSIVETGAARQKDNYSGDGMSTILFDQFINYHNGELYTVDIDEEALKFCQPLVSPKTSLIQSDSVSLLFELSKTTMHIDLLYLDSFDMDWNNPHPSAFHHMKEMLAIMPRITPGTLIVIDDNLSNKGKGQYVKEFMNNIGKKPYFEEYQIGWIW